MILIQRREPASTGWIILKWGEFNSVLGVLFFFLFWLLCSGYFSPGRGKIPYKDIRAGHLNFQFLMAALTNYHQQQKSIVLQFQRPEVQNQGVSRATLLPKVLEETSSSFSSYRCLQAFLSLCVCSVYQSCPTLCKPMDCSPEGSSFHGIFQARILE